MARVVIEVEGGVVTNVYTDSGDVDEYVIIDRDVQREEEDDYIGKFEIDSHIPAEITAEIERAS